MTKNIQRPILCIATLVATLFTYRPIFQGKLLGDPFDSRLMLVLHEHWWRWFNGFVSFRDTEFFYPYKTALGYSDVFFVQGILYSFLRFLNIEMTNSWSITTFSLLLIGSFGWTLIAIKYLKNFLIQIFFILTINTSISFVLYFSFNPNIVGYSFLSWIYLFYKNIINEKNYFKKQFKIEIAIILYFIYALSCWYGAFFVALTLIVNLFLLIFRIKHHKLKNIREIINKINYRLIFIMLPVQIFFGWLFYYIYVSVGDEPFRPVKEMLRNSPRLEFLPNGANINGEHLSGAFFKSFYVFFGLDKENEYTIGIGIVATVLIIYTIFYYFVKDYKIFLSNLFPISIGITYLFFVNFNNFSIHRIFFDLIPGFNSIRSPSRYIILVGFFSIFAIYFFFDQILSRSKKNIVKVLIFILSTFLLIDQYRTPFKGWEKTLLINTDLMSKKEEILSNCDYFFYDKPGGWWFDQIEAITFAVQVGVPTVNGYSGAFPPGYPVESFDSTAQPNKIFDWIGNINPQERGCFIAGSTPIKYLNTGNFSVDYVGFKSDNFNESSKRHLAISPNPFLYVVDYSNNKIKLSFDIFPAICNKNQDIRINLNGEIDLFQGEILGIGKSFDFELKNSIVNKIDIITKSEPCINSKFPEKYYFDIQKISFD